MDLVRHLLTRELDDPASFGAWNVEAARDNWQRFREANGFRGHPRLLTHAADNIKLAKGSPDGRTLYSLSLAPAEESGHNVCRFSTPECRRGCVAFSGNGLYNKVQDARKLKTNFLAQFPRTFVVLLAHEIHLARQLGPCAVRLNTFSDIPWERVTPWLFEWAHDVQFYDYTKWGRGHRNAVNGLPSNYDLTHSVNEQWDANLMDIYLKRGERLAVVVPEGEQYRESWHGWTCVNGDESDARWLDPKPGLVLLKGKGRLRGKGAASTFVKHLEVV